ncbi:MAG: hypothetical protein ACYC36_11365 [Bellilinea sp.]
MAKGIIYTMKTAGFGRINIARLLIGLVIFFNLQAAFLFIINPAAYSTGFEVSGVVGEKLVQGMGILFLMWNVPYIYALTNPIRHRTSLYQAIIMQAIGVVGETILWLTLPSGHPAMESTVVRFAIFDGSGLIALCAALWITRRRS